MNNELIQQIKEDYKICVCSLSDREWLYKFTKSMMSVYCKKWGHDFKFVDHTLDSDRATSWSKLILVKELILTKKYDYVIWIDDDILLTDENKDIKDFIDSNKNIIIQEDPTRKTTNNKRLCYDDINCGFIFFKCDEKTIEIIDKVYMMGEWLPFKRCRNWEQNVFIKYYNEYDNKDCFDIKPYRTFQSFYRGNNEAYSWIKGDFSAHYTGIDKEMRLKCIDETLCKINFK
tara:strand:+ start:143 stop:835 length:693 start_codon:yes stop_codon:yes gene_type:complete